MGFRRGRRLTRDIKGLSAFECADLLKSILRKRACALIPDELQQAIGVAQGLQDTTRVLVSRFINSHLSVVAGKDQLLIRGVLNMLREVIVHVEESKMGAANVASIFALIFFGTPLTQDPLEFVQESKKRTNMLEFLLSLYTEHHDMFDPQHAQLTRLVAKRSIHNKSVLRGEHVTLFFTSETESYVQVSDRVICVDDKELHCSFTDPSENPGREFRSRLLSSRGRQPREKRSASWPRSVHEWVRSGLRG